jgi:hypothetical protein
MGRPLKIEHSGALYQIKSRVNKRNVILLDDLERERFLEILLDYHKCFGIFLHRGDRFR